MTNRRVHRQSKALRANGPQAATRGDVSLAPHPLRRRSFRGRAARCGLSLLEVMLSIAILGGALVVIGELMRIGSRSAQAARDLSQAQLICESTMAEITAGILPPQPLSRQAYQTEPDWLYSVEVERVDQAGLLSIKVIVEQDLPPQKRPLTFSLTRWMVDPGIELEESSETSSSQSTSGSTSTGSQGSSN